MQDCALTLEFASLPVKGRCAFPTSTCLSGSHPFNLLVYRPASFPIGPPGTQGYLQPHCVGPTVLLVFHLIPLLEVFSLLLLRLYRYVFEFVLFLKLLITTSLNGYASLPLRMAGSFLLVLYLPLGSTKSTWSPRE